MSKINKLITNKPVTLTEEEVTNLSKTLSAVQTAGGGGGGGGRVYYGDGTTISVNQIDGIISLTTDATEKLNTPIPTKVSDLTDYEDHQTVDKMSAYLTTAQYNSDSAKFATKTELETTAATFEGLIQSYVQGLASEAWVTEQGYLTKPSGDLYYTPLPAGLSDDQYYAMTNSGWKVIQGGGGQGGISTVAHDSSLSGNGNSENLGIKTDAALNLTNASAKSAVSAVYANIAKGDHTDYNLGSTLDTMSNITALIDTTLMSVIGYNGIEKQIDETTYYATAFGLTNSAYAAIQYVTANSGDWNNVSAKLDTTAAAQTYLDKTTYATDSATFVMSSTTAITGTKQYALTTTGWTEVQAGSTFTGVITANTLSGDGLTDPLGINLTASMNLTNASAKSATWASQFETTAGHTVELSDLNDLADGLNTKLLDLAFNMAEPYNGIAVVPDSDDYPAMFGLTDTAYNAVQYITANSGNLVTSSIQTITGTKQYALTTTGWEEVDVPSTTDYLPLSGGTVSGSTYFSAVNGQNMIAVASAATLIGASRQTSANFGQNDNAMGTTWVGVGGPGMYRGFLKYTQGGNVGALDSNNTMQVEFTPNNKGTIFAKAKNSGNDCPETQILNPTKASCDTMVQSAIDSNNMSGPNYMIAKNADGQFVIGAAVYNCQGNLPGTLTPNTYYFVY